MAKLFLVYLDDFAYTDLSDPVSVKQSKRHSSTVPIYGRIPARVPIEDVEDIEGYIEIEGQRSSATQDYFALRIDGDSMHPEYRDGDVVLFERQSTCESGSDCAVRIGDSDATFKKVRNMVDFIVLQPINPEYEPIHVIKSEGTPVEIIGIAREIRRKV